MSPLSIKDNIENWLEHTLGFNHQQQNLVFQSLSILLVIWLMYFIASRILVSRIKKQESHYQWRKTLGYLSFGLGCLLIGRLWFPGFQSITTFLGLVSAGLAIAFKDVLTDIGGWIFIIYKKPFKTGDRVQVGSHAGDVIDINVFQFTLLEIGGERVYGEQSSGRMIHVPNNHVFTHPIANYTEGFRYIWHEIAIIVTFESDWGKSKKILEQIAQEHTGTMAEAAFKEVKSATKRYMIRASNLGPRVYTSIHDSGVQFVIRYLCTPYNRRDTVELISENILKEFQKHLDIDFAYPTSRIYREELDGKRAVVQKPNL